MKRLPDDAVRAFADEHLLYEIAMVAGLARRLSRFKTLLDSEDMARDGALAEELFEIAGRNADIEAFTVHARVLLEFFYRDQRRKNVAIAADFFSDDDTWRGVRPEKSSNLRKIEGRVGTEIAHLTYGRAAASTTPEWAYNAIWHDLSEVVRLFVDEASPERLSYDFRTKVRAILDADRDRDRRLALLGVTTSPYQLGVATTSEEYHGGTAVLPVPQPPLSFD
jgi:hypothetical protein